MQTVIAMRDPKGADTLFAAGPEAAADKAPNRAAPAVTASARGAFLPLLLGLLALVSWLGFQAWLQNQDRQQLQAANTALSATVETAAGLRRSLDLLAADTQRLADAGNGNAKLLVDELRKRGVTINASSTAPAGAVPPGSAAR